LRDRVAALCTRVFEAEEPAPAPPPVPAPLRRRLQPWTWRRRLRLRRPSQPASTGKRIGQVGSVALAALGVPRQSTAGFFIFYISFISGLASKFNIAEEKRGG